MFENLNSKDFGSLDCLEQEHYIYYIMELDEAKSEF